MEKIEAFVYSANDLSNHKICIAYILPTTQVEFEYLHKISLLLIDLIFSVE